VYLDAFVMCAMTHVQTGASKVSWSLPVFTRTMAFRCLPPEKHKKEAEEEGGKTEEREKEEEGAGMKVQEEVSATRQCKRSRRGHVLKEAFL